MAASPPRPSLVTRTMSTPPVTPNSKYAEGSHDIPAVGSSTRPNIPTPPTSPRQCRSASSISRVVTPGSAQQSQTMNSDTKARSGLLGRIETNMSPNVQSRATETSERDVRKILDCPFDIEHVLDANSRPVTFGYGAWSVVYKATTKAKSIPASSSENGLSTPPSSPAFPPPALVAVKTAARKDAASILVAEAKILTYLSRIPNATKYTVAFYGVLDTSLVLEALPYSLESHILSCAHTASAGGTSHSWRDPVIGSESVWLSLAQRLVTALHWLHHTACVVHGDIKPGNILLSSISGAGQDMRFTPLFADFSSSQRSDTLEITPNTLSAITREYTAPELLVSSVLKDPLSAATEASDVFSLAVTLLVAATGNTRVYEGSVWQRQAMATQGWTVLGNVRNGEGGMRVPRKGVVEEVIAPAVRKVDCERADTSAWLTVVEEMVTAREKL